MPTDHPVINWYIYQFVQATILNTSIGCVSHSIHWVIFNPVSLSSDNIYTVIELPLFLLCSYNAFILTAPIYEVKFPLQFKKLKGKNTLTQFCDRSHVTSSTGHLLLEPFTVTVRHLIYLKVFNVFKHAYRSSCYQLVHISIRTGYHIEHIYWMCESFNTLSHFQSRLTLQWQHLHRHWTSTFPPM